MCILFIYVDPNPKPNGYRLIVASNRDEYYQRPARDAFKCPETGIIGGWDMEPGKEGGMWLGAVKPPEGSGKRFQFAALLNITGVVLKNSSGRGVLVKDYLKGPLTAEEYTKKLAEENKDFMGFNLVTVELGSEEADVHSYSNAPPIRAHFKGKQILGFGNSPIHTPFVKVTRGRKEFEKIIEKKQTKEELIEDLISLLKNEVRHLPDDELETRVKTYPEDLSSIFVRVKHLYGSRAHSVVLVNDNWEAEFIEHAILQPATPEHLNWTKTVIKANL